MSTKKIPALKFKQKKYQMLLLNLDVETIRRLFYVFRKSKDQVDALQRKLVKRKVDDIENSMSKEKVCFPNSIIVNLNPEFSKNILLKEDGCIEIALPIDDNLSNYENLEEKEGRIGYIIDGQHRIEGLKKFPNLILPVVMFLNLDDTIAFKTFADINEKQEKVSKILLNYIRWEIKDYSDDLSSIAFDITKALNENRESPLLKKVKLYEDETNKWITSPTLQKLVKSVIDENSPIYQFSKDKKIKTLVDYLNAWMKLYPEQWDNFGRQDYVLTKAMGITIMFKLFPNLYRRCKNLYGQEINTDSFVKTLQPLTKYSIEIDEESTFLLDWNSNNFGSLSSGKGINLISKILMGNILEDGQIVSINNVISYKTLPENQI